MVSRVLFVACAGVQDVVDVGPRLPGQRPLLRERVEDEAADPLERQTRLHHRH